MNTQWSQTLRAPVARVEVTNAFLRGVYNWMAVGLGLTAVISYFLTYTSFNAFLFTQQGVYVGIGSIVAELALVFYLSFRINKISPATATSLFMVYSALNGISLSFILVAYSVGSVAQAFIACTCMFGAMSLYGLYTKRDLAGWGSFLFMGLIGIIVASIINIFMQSSMMNFAISLIGVGVFLGLTAYDTQLLKEMGSAVPENDGAAVRRATIMGALKLYLDFLNLFIMLLRLLGDRR
jgi:FtsH-binding integral membrane protein